MDMRYASVALELIDLQDSTCIVTAGRDPGELARLLARTGMLQPVVLAPREDDRYRVVCGYRRTCAAAQVGWPEVPALLLPGGTAETRMVELAIVDNAAHRQWNALEQARAVEKLLGHVRPAEVTQHWLPLLGLPPTGRALARAQALAGLNAPAQQALLSGQLAPKSAERLSAFSAADQEALCAVLARVHLSVSAQAEVINAWADIMRRDKLTAAQVAADPAVQEVLAAPDISPGPRGEQLRTVVRARRYPRLAAKQRWFGDLKKKLQPGPGLELMPPPGFEGTTYCVRIGFSRPEELARGAARAAALAHTPEMGRLFGDEQ